MGKIFVLPAPGIMIPHPDRRGSSEAVRIAAEGEWVDDDPYWHRLAAPSRDGSGDAPCVTIGEPASSPASSKRARQGEVTL